MIPSFFAALFSVLVFEGLLRLTWQAPGAWEVEEKNQARRKSAALVKQNGKRARKQSEKGKKNSAPFPVSPPEKKTLTAPWFVLFCYGEVLCLLFVGYE